MNVQEIQLLYDYNCWANERILGAAERVPPEQYAHAQLGYCRLHDTLVHIVAAERRWRERWQDLPNAPMLAPAVVPSLAALRHELATDQRLMRAYLAGLSDADLAREFDYQRLDGTPITNTLWHTLAHLVNHGTQHRAELALLLTELGCSPGNLDLVIYVRQSTS